MVDDNDLTEALETFVDERLEDAGISRRTLLRRGVLAGAGLGALPMLLAQAVPPSRHPDAWSAARRWTR